KVFRNYQAGWLTMASLRNVIALEDGGTRRLVPPYPLAPREVSRSMPGALSFPCALLLDVTQAFVPMIFCSESPDTDKNVCDTLSGDAIHVVSTAGNAG
ncbi:MAG TPA: hypothetical protein PKH07_13520, partial [bacterium]|nr:hypothetical protein [bacterium]